MSESAEEVLNNAVVNKVNSEKVSANDYVESRHIEDFGDPDMFPVFDLLNMDINDSKERHIGEVLWEWAKDNADSDSQTDRLWALRMLRRRLGSPQLGETVAGKMFKYVVLLGKRESIDRELSDYEG